MKSSKTKFYVQDGPITRDRGAMTELLAAHTLVAA
jgi:hypothetical protein